MALCLAGCHKGDQSDSNTQAPAAPAATSTPSGPSGPAATNTPASTPAGPTAGTAAANATENVTKLKVKNALRTAKPPIDAGAITVDVSGSTITLSGTVSDAKQKAAAEKAAKSVAGSNTVENKLTVK